MRDATLNLDFIGDRPGSLFSRRTPSPRPPRAVSTSQARDADDGTENSNGEGGSSPETSPEAETKPVAKPHGTKKKKIKINRQPRIIKSPPEKPFVPIYNEEDFKRASEARGGFYADKSTATLMMPAVDVNGNNTFLTPSPRLDRRGALRPSKSNDEDLLDSLRRDFRKEHSRTESNSECTLVLLGDQGVGKTAFAVRFVTRRYLHEYDPELERTYSKAVNLNGEEIAVLLHDTVGKSWLNYRDQADAFILMYSVTSEQSYKNAKNTVTSIRRADVDVRTIPILLVGNKCDLESARTVKRVDAEYFATSHDCVFKEITVAETTNMDWIIKPLMKRLETCNAGRSSQCSDCAPNDSLEGGSPPSSPTKISVARKPTTRHAFKFLSKKRL